MITIDKIQCKITIQQERFYNNDSCWGVYAFTTTDDIPCFQSKKLFNNVEYKYAIVAGKMQQLVCGQEYKLTATVKYDSKYKSWQYNPLVVQDTTPVSNSDKVAFLQSILTENEATTLLSAYPDIIERVLQGQDIDLARTKGIKESTWEKCKTKIVSNYGISDILVLLSPLGVTYNMIQKLISEESQPELLKQKLLNNPYMMTKIRGLGFTKVDNLALKLKPELRCSLERTLSYIRYMFHTIGEGQGHTYISTENLRQNVLDDIPECKDIFENILSDKEKYCNFLHIDNDKIGLTEYFDKEMAVFNILKSLTQYDRKYKLDIDTAIKQSEKEQGFNFSEEQVGVINNAIKHNVVLITGQAGTGKSTIARAILNVYKNANLTIRCCALAAKASQVITEHTGFPSQTIHRLLGCQGIRSGVSQFVYNHSNPLLCDVLFIDEFSMVNIPIALSLLSAVREGTKVIICGDNGQLPPIGYGNIFNDLLAFTNDFFVCKLTTVHRQAQMSGIVVDANNIRNGIDPLPKKEMRVIHGQNEDMIYQFRNNREGLREIGIKSYLNAVKKWGTDNCIIVVPRKDTVINSVSEINNIIQDALISADNSQIKYGQTTFRVGAKVIQKENDYDKDVYNGEIGYITEITQTKRGKSSKETTLKVRFGENKIVEYQVGELSQLQLAYALTVHSAQGSGYTCVVCIIDNTHYTLLDNCLLYTALTRAKDYCMLLAEPPAYNRALNKNNTKIRQTWLSVLKNEKNTN